MVFNDTLTALNYHLARRYRNEDDALRVADLANINTLVLDTAGDPINRWFVILNEAFNAFGDGGNWTKIKALLNVVTTPPERGAEDSYLLGLRDSLAANLVPADKPDTPEWKAQPDAGHLEKLMGSVSTLLPISFLEQGLDCSRAVARIVVGRELGTGFLVSDNLLVTNNHVIQSAAEAATALVQFNFQKTRLGNDSQVVEMQLDPDAGFVTSKERDHTIVRLKGDANAQFGALTFSTTPAQKDDFVNIIQHPAGGPKQIALYHNVVTFADDDVVQYLTDTLPGSSGSPVFNTDWQVVALHNSGGKLVEPGSGLPVIRNAGIAGARVQEAVKALIRP